MPNVAEFYSYVWSKLWLYRLDLLTLVLQFSSPSPILFMHDWVASLRNEAMVGWCFRMVYLPSLIVHCFSVCSLLLQCLQVQLQN